MSRHVSGDKLLAAYDCISEERLQLRERIALAVVSHENSLDQASAQAEIKSDFSYFSEDWRIFLATTKERFGVAIVTRVLTHMGMDANGRDVSQHTGP